MIITRKTALVRNLFVSGTNGILTCIILLIAPLGLVAVMVNTLLVMIATFATAQAADRVIRFLQNGDSARNANGIQVLPEDESGRIQRRR
jgi:hypothetical protein